MKAAILTIGDEIMIGQIVDTNSTWIAAWLDLNGWKVTRKLGVRDEIPEIIKGIDLCYEDADLVITTGGLGPTKDDLTKDALCQYYNSKLIWHEETWSRVKEILKRINREPSDLHKVQCYLPENARIIPNDQGSAPGMMFEESNKILVSVPGVPHEMKHLLSEKIIQLLPKGEAVEHRFVRTAGEGETVLAEMIEDIESALPSDIKLAYLPSFSQVTLRLTSYGDGKKERMDVLQKQIVDRLGDLVYSTSLDISLSKSIGDILRKRNETIGTGESCTGGYLSHLITAVSGSSDYFIGSIVPYAYRMKTSELDVPQEMLWEFGAVSEEVVRSMAEGVRKNLDVTWALSTSGIAGPTGGTPQKPVGTIWIACSGPNGTKARLLKLTRDRVSNIEYASIAALVLLRKMLLEEGEG
ncbi:MAG: CinA family nicotinamide mononucleotide deamidase-related protein [Saprospiraceae bacterium]|uniref:CinA-like protein n=1 Tax=Candidatus Opimibacter skivensis TaxID=2982028 RepID=A0A9D7SZB7_9BACT|nr:CinA family nicotinamide mononucleotide deamidase-related protein [Candidatus Opimibacter skivensis]